ncbi:hypothetical protein [Synechococcus elongatus]|uniref:hypothetical protein n=1 Tax=Synechococcus elongatus TaxID=32046 RepID=UPI000F7DD7D8|nr:hypothetical protein [Synechococcus elongatus]
MTDELSSEESAFLDLIAKDVDQHPERLIPFTQKILDLFREFIGGIDELDLDAPFDPNDE